MEQEEVTSTTGGAGVVSAGVVSVRPGGGGVSSGQDLGVCQGQGV